MNLAEATRQYQATLEARRTLRTVTEGCVSFDGELEAADGDVLAAWRAVFVVWAREQAA